MPLEGGGESGLEPAGAYGTLKTLTLVLVVIWAGGILSTWLAGRGITLPGFVAAMLLAVVVRNAGDRTRAVRVNRRAVENLGTIALSLFLVMAMMALGSWDVPAFGIPLAVMFATQVLVTGLFAGLVTFRAMGADYDAAVMAAGHCGLGLGAAPAATAAMARVVARSGPANRACLVVPAVGVYFNDVTNGIIITTYLNLVR
jgi:ESS family glutamate:Na+ symporter